MVCNIFHGIDIWVMAAHALHASTCRLQCGTSRVPTCAQLRHEAQTPRHRLFCEYVTENHENLCLRLCTPLGYPFLALASGRKCPSYWQLG